MFAVSCSSESIGRRLGMSMNSRSGWLKSGAEHYQTLLSTNEESICLPVLHRGLLFRIFSVSSWKTGELDKLSAKMTEIWTKYALCALF